MCMLLLCREYYFLDTENSRYFKLSSKTRGHTKRNNEYLYLLSLRSKVVFIWFRRKERPINGIFGFGHAVSFLVPFLRSQMETLATQAISTFKRQRVQDPPLVIRC